MHNTSSFPNGNCTLFVRRRHLNNSYVQGASHNKLSRPERQTLNFNQWEKYIGVRAYGATDLLHNFRLIYVVRKSKMELVCDTNTLIWKFGDWHIVCIVSIIKTTTEAYQQIKNSLR